MNQSKHLTLPRLVLASTSPRRSALLKLLGIPFEIQPPEGEEWVADAKNVEKIAAKNAEMKANSVLPSQEETTIVIGADTLVVFGKSVMGKPKNREEIRQNLVKLSGKTHQVLTGLALLSKKYGKTTHTVTSEITFRDLSEEEIFAYSQTTEPLDKAGGYASQGLASRFVKSIQGSHANIVGFPIEVFLDELESLSGISVYDWVV